MDRERHGNAKDTAHREAGAQSLSGYADSAAPERKRRAHAHRGKQGEPENKRHREDGIGEGARSQRNDSDTTNHDRVHPPHEHLPDESRNDRRSQREGAAAFGNGLDKKRHGNAGGGERRKRRRRKGAFLRQAAIRQPLGARACGP